MISKVACWLPSHPATSPTAAPGRDLATTRGLALAAVGLTEVLVVVARRHLDGGLWVVPFEQSWSAALPYDWRFSGRTATVLPLVRGLAEGAEGAEHAAALRGTATAATSAVSGPPAPAPSSAVHVAQQGMPSTRDLAAALAARPMVLVRPHRPALAPGARPHEPTVRSKAVHVER